MNEITLVRHSDPNIVLLYVNGELKIIAITPEQSSIMEEVVSAVCPNWGIHPAEGIDWKYTADIPNRYEDIVFKKK